MAHFEKYTKEECEYGPGDWPKECGTCAHYTESKATHRSPEGQGSCKIVVGRIDPTGLCKFHVYAKGKESLEDKEGSEDIGKLEHREQIVRSYRRLEEGQAPSKSISQSQINEFLKWNEGSEEVQAPQGTAEDYWGRARFARRLRERTSKEFIRGREWCEICKMWHDPGHSH